MSLPTLVFTGDAGSASIANKTWTLGTDGDGYPYYNWDGSEDGGYLRWDAADSVWIFDYFDTASSASGVSLAHATYYSNGGQTLASGPAGAYALGAGFDNTPPAPTVTAYTNPQIVIGGDAVAFTLPSSGGAAPSGKSIGVYDPSGVKVSDAPDYGGTTVSGGTHGWTVEVSSYTGAVTVQAPAAADATYAHAASEYLVVVGESSGYAWGNFDLLAPPPPPHLLPQGEARTFEGDGFDGPEYQLVGEPSWDILFADAQGSSAVLASNFEPNGWDVDCTDNLNVTVRAPRDAVIGPGYEARFSDGQ